MVLGIRFHFCKSERVSPYAIVSWLPLGLPLCASDWLDKVGSVLWKPSQKRRYRSGSRAYLSIVILQFSLMKINFGLSNGPAKLNIGL